MNTTVHDPLSDVVARDAEVELKPVNKLQPNIQNQKRSSGIIRSFEDTHQLRVNMDVNSVSYSLILGNKYKTILQDINIHLPHSSMCAIMGPSGAGKSTLLDLLADRKRSGIQSGSILINQAPRSPLFSRESAYVMQDDVHNAELTVTETLRYSVWTRLPEGTSAVVREERVQDLLQLMGLVDVRDMQVGSALIKGISGGQKRRLSIAESIVALPPLVFLDEPTSGLDSAMALEVMQTVKALTQQGRTCISSIHQPSPQLFALFTRVVLLDAGRLVFYGAPADVLSYFTAPTLGYVVPGLCRYSAPDSGTAGQSPHEIPNDNTHCSQSYSVAEFLVDICNREGKLAQGAEPKSAAELASIYASSALAQMYIPNPPLTVVGTDTNTGTATATATGTETGTGETETEAVRASTVTVPISGIVSVGLFERRHATRKLTQLRMLLHRAATIQIRNKAYFLGTLKRSVIIGVIGGVFFQGQGKLTLPFFQSNGVPTDEQLSMSAMIFFLLVYIIDSNDHVIPRACEQIHHYRREIEAFAYCPSAYWICAVVEQLPLLFVSHTILITILFFAVQLPLSFAYYCYFHIMYFLATVMSYYLSMTVAAWTGSAAASYAIVTNVILFVQFFAGFTVQLSSLPIGWQWVSTVNFARYAYQGLMMNEFGYSDYNNGSETDGDGQSVLVSLGFSSPSKTMCMLYVVLNIACMCFLLYLGFRRDMNQRCEQRESIPVDGTEAVSGYTAAMQRGVVMLQHSLNRFFHSCKKLCCGCFLPDSISDSDSDSTVSVDRLEWPHIPPQARRQKVGLLSLQSSSSSFSPSSSSSLKDLRCELVFMNISYSVSSSKPAIKYEPKSKSVAQDCRAETITAAEVVAASTSGNDTSDTEKRISGSACGNTESMESLESPDGRITLLQDVSGCVLPGELCAIMGPSGAGKTTLMNVLAGRLPAGSSNNRLLQGSVRYNGQTKAPSTAYVMQDNVHIPTLTVRETLTFAAHLRMSEKLSETSKTDQVSMLLEMLALEHIAGSTVGNENCRGISGGELRRLSIGVEIIHLPSLIFLDEPTTGLDAWHALDTMTAVRNLSSQMLTITCTIHQPSAAIFSLFHTLLLLSAGRVLYFGPAAGAVSYFTQTLKMYTNSSQGYCWVMPSDINPADFLLGVAVGKNLFQPSGAVNSSGNATSTLLVDTQDLVRSFAESQRLIENLHERAVARWIDVMDVGSVESTDAAGVGSYSINSHPQYQYHTSAWMQTVTLCRRTILRNIRDPTTLITYFVRHVLIAIFYGSLYLHLPGGTATAAYTNRLALMFYTLMFVVFSNIQQVTAVFESRLLFYREQAANAYGPVPYFISTFVVSIPAAFVNVLIFSLILYNMVGFYPSTGHFGFFFGTLFLCSITGLFLCHLVANNSSNTSAALTVLPIFMFLTLMLAGFIVLIPDLPSYLGAWATTCSFMRWGFQALVLNEFEKNPELPYGSFYIQDFAFNHPDKGTCLGILICFTLLFMIATVLTLKYVHFEKR